ncbi:MAG: cbb3-type cytochrome oxidase assembly protein CcoS [Gammaproteobacteria bacterium]|nr:MAG: cbb3-type cytochrome oxidase assembly protein CcoS [Gammaproteobacteria bacterium]
MEIIFLLIPLALILLAIIIGLYLWSIKSGQFDDLEGPAHEILMEDDEPMEKRENYTHRNS